MPLMRTAIAGKPLKLGHWYAVDPSCASTGQTEIRVLAKPQNGTVEIRNAEDYPSYPPNNVRSACNKTAVPATQVWYTPKEAFSGSDQLSMLVIFPSGASRNLSYQINVVP